MGMLKEKTVLYVTHQVEFLPAADLILVCKMGTKSVSFPFKKRITSVAEINLLIAIAFL